MAEKIGFEIDIKTDDSVKSIKELKNEIKLTEDAISQLTEKFGANSKEVENAQKRLAALQDAQVKKQEQINQRIDNAAKTVSALSAAYGGVQGALELTGLAGEDTMKQLAKIQSALAIGDAIQNLSEFRGAISSTFSMLKDSAVNAFKAIKGAIGATGIGLLVIALGALVANWDKIKRAISGTNKEQEKLLEKQKQSSEASRKALDNISKQENILKLQGKSEKEILKTKIAASQVAIRDLEAQLITQENLKKSQVEAAQRNKNILEGILKFITAPIMVLLKAVDGVGKAVGKNFGLEEKFYGGIASMLFDPEEVATNADATIEETKNKLDELKNQSAGFQLQMKDMDKKSADDAKKTEDDKLQKIKDANENAIKEIETLKQENYLKSIKDDNEREQEKLRLDYENKKKEIENSVASEELKSAQLKQLTTQFFLDQNALIEKYNEEQRKKKEEEDKKRIEAEKETFRIINEERINSITDNFQKQQELEALRYQTEVDNLLDLLNKKEITEDEYQQRRQSKDHEHERTLAQIKKDGNDAQLKLDTERFNNQMDLADKTSGILSKFADVVGKQTAVGKGLAIASALIDTYSGAMKAFRATYSPIGPVDVALRFASVAATIAAGIKNVKEIAKVQVPGGGSSSVPNAAPASAAVLAPVAAQLSSTSLNQQMINSMNNATNRSFVLESDISGNQERIQRLNRAARIS